MTDIDTDALPQKLRQMAALIADPSRSVCYAAADALDRIQQPFEGELAEIEARQELMVMVPDPTPLELELLQDRATLLTALKQVTVEREHHIKDKVRLTLHHAGKMTELRAELDAARERIQEYELIKVCTEGSKIIPAHALEKLRADLAAARDALRKYGHHNPGCDIFKYADMNCTCGLSDALGETE